MALKKPSAKVNSTETAAKEETVVAEQDAAESSATTDTAVATVDNTKAAVALGAQAPTGSLEQELIANGFEGLEAGYHSFLSIKLPSDGIFCTSEEDQIGKSIQVRLLGSKQKFVYNRSDDDEAVLFSYDRTTTTTGESLEDALAEWSAEGATVTEKK